MLAKLAFGNIRKLLHDYAIYFVTLVLGVAVFYAFNTIAVQADFLVGDVGAMLKQIGNMLRSITVFLAVVMGFLMVYANNFLMRRRKKELGLYQVLGMRPGQVNTILTIETLCLAAASVVVGVALGVLLSQLLLFVTAGMFQVSITHFKFFFSMDALRLTLGCFVITYLVMLVFNSITLSRVRLIDLMGSAKRGEKNHVRSLPLSIVLFAAGVAMVAYAYWRLVTQGFPGFTEGTSGTDFLVTTLVVCVGTFVLFFGLGGALTGILTRMRGFFWRDLHMFTVRQIASKINSACVSMSFISLILFVAITSVTGGMSICSSLNSQVDQAAPYDATVRCVAGSTSTYTASDIEGLSQLAAQVADDPSTYSNYVELHEYSPYFSSDSDYADFAPQNFTLQSVADATGQKEVPEGFENSWFPGMMVSQSEFNALRKLSGLDPISFGDNQYLLLCNMAQLKPFLNNALVAGYKLTLGGYELAPARASVVDDSSSVFQNFAILMTDSAIVVPDAVVANLPVYAQDLIMSYTVPADQGDQMVSKLREGLTSVVCSGSDDPTAERLYYYVDVASHTDVLKEGTTTTGLVSYLAIYIGFVLVVACAAILAIQQLSGVSDSAGRYRTLSELGCSERLIFGSLRSQVVISFVLPLVVGLAHSACALSVIMRYVSIFGIVNMASSSVLCVGIFVLVYGGYLAITYRTAHGVVRGALLSARHEL